MKKVITLVLSCGNCPNLMERDDGWFCIRDEKWVNNLLSLPPWCSLDDAEYKPKCQSIGKEGK